MSCMLLPHSLINTIAAGMLVGLHTKAPINSFDQLAEKQGFGSLLLQESLQLANQLAFRERYQRPDQLIELNIDITPSQPLNSSWGTMLRMAQDLEYNIDQFTDDDPRFEAQFVKDVLKALRLYQREIVKANSGKTLEKHQAAETAALMKKAAARYAAARA